MFSNLRMAHAAVFALGLAVAAFVAYGLVQPLARRSGKEARQVMSA